MRWLAFGRLVGGGVRTNYLSFLTFIEFHTTFFKSLFNEHMFQAHGVPVIGLWCVLLLASGVVLVALRQREFEPAYLRNLIFVGPVWYFVSTLVLYGVYFDPRHNVLPVIGLIMFVTLLLDGVRKCVHLGLSGQRVVVGSAILACVLAFLPPTTALSRQYHVASVLVKQARTQIEREAAGLPEGSAILVRNVPQFDTRPYYFGWGLQSALKRPFTKSDLANKSLVVNFRNIEMNRYQFKIPAHFDRVITLAGSWPFEKLPDW